MFGHGTFLHRTRFAACLTFAAICGMAGEPIHAAGPTDALTLFAHYDAEAATATDVPDVSGNGNDALNVTLVTATADGPWRNYLRFDGEVNSASSYATLPDLPTSLGSMAVGLRFRIDGPNSSTPSQEKDQYLISNHSDQNNPEGGFGIRVLTTQAASKIRVDLTFLDGSTSRRVELLSKTIVAFDAWYQVLTVYNGDVLRLYVNGVLESQIDIDPAWVLQDGPAGCDLTLGALGKQAPAHFPLNGDLDEVRIWTAVPADELWVMQTHPPSSTMAAFSFNDEHAATMFLDETGNELHAIRHFGALHQPTGGILQGSVGFDGSEDFLKLPTKDTGADDPWEHGFAVSAWVKPAPFAPEPSREQQYIVSNNSDSGTPAGGFSLHLHDTVDKFAATVDLVASPSPLTLYATQLVVPERWYHVVMTFDGSSVALYVNAELGASAEFDEASLAAPPYNTHIGEMAHQASTSHHFPFKGSIDEMRFYSHGLSRHEVRQLYLHGRSRQEGLFCDFDEDRGLTANAGAVGGELTLAVDAEADEAGAFGRALRFPGTSSSYAVVDASTDNTDGYADAFTAAAWVNADAFSQETWAYILSCDSNAATRGGFHVAIHNGVKKFAVSVDTDTAGRLSPIYSTTVLSADTWYHVAARFDGTSLRLYVDGVEEAATTFSADTMRTPQYDLHLGAMADGASSWFKHLGSVDEVMLVDRAMSGAEIARLAGRAHATSTPPIRNKWVLPREPVWDGWPGTQGVELSAAPGEYESASVQLVAGDMATQFDDLRLTVDQDLQMGGYVIDTSDVAIHLVKCWYQIAGDTIEYSTVRELKPELLLHDDALVTPVDSTQSNTIVNEDQPQDASTLQPLDLPAGRCQQYWLTVHVPDTAPPGLYTGALSVKSGAQLAFTVPIQVQVQDVALSPARLDYSIYYIGRLPLSTQSGKTDVVNKDWKTQAQYEAEMKNLVAHGVLTPSMYAKLDPGPDPFVNIDIEMAKRDLAGMPGASEGAAIPYLGINGHHTDYLGTSDPGVRQAILNTYEGELDDVIAHFSSNGYPEPLFYGKDEASGTEMADQIPLYELIHDRGGRSITAVYPGYYAQLETAQTGAGALIDVAVIHAGDDPYQNDLDAIAADAADNKAWSYHDPQVGYERPFTYRYKFGLWLWARGFDGACDFAYMTDFGGTPWDDFDDPEQDYSEHNFVYPTVDGVVDTIQWEGFREGIDDVRYLSTLLDLIDEARSQGFNQLADREEAYVDRLKNRLLNQPISEDHMPAIRAALIRKIKSVADDLGL